MTMSVHKIT